MGVPHLQKYDQGRFQWKRHLYNASGIVKTGIWEKDLKYAKSVKPSVIVSGQMSHSNGNLRRARQTTKTSPPCPGSPAIASGGYNIRKLRSWTNCADLSIPPWGKIRRGIQGWSTTWKGYTTNSLGTYTGYWKDGLKHGQNPYL